MKSYNLSQHTFMHVPHKNLSFTGLQVTNICWVSSGTVSARYCCEPREVSGAKPVMKKCSRGKGTKFTAIFPRGQEYTLQVVAICLDYSYIYIYIYVHTYVYIG